MREPDVDEVRCTLGAVRRDRYHLDAQRYVELLSREGVTVLERMASQWPLDWEFATHTATDAEPNVPVDRPVSRTFAFSGPVVEVIG